MCFCVFTKYSWPTGNKTIVMVFILDQMYCQHDQYKRIDVSLLSNMFSSLPVFLKELFVFISTHPRLRLSSIKVHSMLCLKWSQVIHTWVAQLCSPLVQIENKSVRPLQTIDAWKMDFVTLNPTFLGPKRLKIKLMYTQEYECQTPLLHNITLENRNFFSFIKTETRS